jgi:membrane-associated phospholipid phosphatase
LEKLTAMISARGVNTPNATRMLALVNVAMYDATIACWRNKYLHRRPRPAALDPGISPLVETPDSPSFPSEYAATSAAAAAVLSYLFPADGSLYTDLAQEAGRSRLFAGVEFPSDYLAGFDLGKRVARFP